MSKVSQDESEPHPSAVILAQPNNRFYHPPKLVGGAALPPKRAWGLWQKYLPKGFYQFAHAVRDDVKDNPLALELYIVFEIRENAHSSKVLRRGGVSSVDDFYVIVMCGPWISVDRHCGAYPVSMVAKNGEIVPFVKSWQHPDAQFMFANNQFVQMTADGSWKEVQLLEMKKKAIGPCEYWTSLPQSCTSKWLLRFGKAYENISTRTKTLVFATCRNIVAHVVNSLRVAKYWYAYQSVTNWKFPS